MVGTLNKPGILLDVSRLVSRIGTGPLTGIDRVEAAWLAHIADREHMLLCRVTRGQALLPPAAGPMILRWISGDVRDLPSRPGWREWLIRRDNLPARAKTALRNIAQFASCRNGIGLVAEVKRHMTANITYLNCGHTNLDRSLLNNLSGLKRMVMLHDTIPLDHPEFTRSGQSERFRNRFMTALSLADQIISISSTTANSIEYWRKRLAIARNPPVTIAHIGTTLTPPNDQEVPPDLMISSPFFVSLGTIEPRKNHRLLLDVWDIFARTLPPEKIPYLLIIGRRGWENHDVFSRLDHLSPNSPIIERADLSDGAVAALISKSHGLLMPSRAEGFGLPLTEAAGRGVPVFSAPIPSACELLGEYARYLSPDDPEEWVKELTSICKTLPSQVKLFTIPSWDSHFECVDKAITTPSE